MRPYWTPAPKTVPWENLACGSLVENPNRIKGAVRLSQLVRLRKCFKTSDSALK